jgi:hypothetical protein
VPPSEFSLPLRLPLSTGAAGAKGVVVLDVSVFYCSDTDGTCRMKTLHFRAPFTVSNESDAKTLTLRAPVP